MNKAYIAYREKVTKEDINCLHFLLTLWELTGQWTTQFENPPEFPFFFMVEVDGTLYFAGKKLCKIDDQFDIDRFDYDVDYFTFVTTSGDRFTFMVNWPYDSSVLSIDVFKNGNWLFLCESPDYTKTNKE